MEAIENLTQINYLLIILWLFALLFGIKEIIEILSYFKKKFRIKTGVDEDKETIEERISVLERHDKWQYNEISKISKCVEEIKDTILDKSLDDYRYEILDFASSLSNGREYNNEAFNHIFRIYAKYEKILENNGMENGLAEESIKFIREKYNEKLKSGKLK